MIKKKQRLSDNAPIIGVSEESAPDFVRFCLNQLGSKNRKCLVDFLEKEKILDLATACSGTENPALVWAAFQKVFEEMLGVKVEMPSRFACEIDCAKRSFIMEMMPGIPCLFGDATQLNRSSLLNFVNGELCAVPKAKSYIMGFPCQDVSPLNSQATASENMHTIADSSLRTGTVFKSGKDLLDENEDENAGKFLLLENVQGLARRHADGTPSNLRVALEQLRKKNFAHAYLLDPRVFGNPSSRLRLYIPVVPLWLLAKLGIDSTALPECCLYRLTHAVTFF